MTPLKVRATVQLPPDGKGRMIAPGSEFFADPDDPYVATQLSVGHLIPIGPIPALSEDDPPTQSK